MSWQRWVDELRHAPEQAVADLLRGAADISPFERATPHEFLLAVLPRDSRLVPGALLGEPRPISAEPESSADLPALLDKGLWAWLLTQRQSTQPPARKLGGYAAEVCEAMQWPLYFALPKTHAALQAERPHWIKWLGPLAFSAYRDPEYDYWQVLAARQSDDQLQSFWQSFVVEAGRTRSSRYLNLGLLALAKLPLSEDDSPRNLRLQVQALINRYQRRRGWGTPALEDLAEGLRGVMARNPSMNAAHYLAFLSALLASVGDHASASVLSLLGLAQAAQRFPAAAPKGAYKLVPPGSIEVSDQTVQAVRQSHSLAEGWKAIQPLVDAHEDFMHKSGDAYHFVRTLDRCARVLCERYALDDAPQVQARLFQWVHLALRVDEDNPRLWMLWELVLRRAGHVQRAQWVLWEMSRRFPENVHCRVDLARLLAASNAADDQRQAHHLLQQALLRDPDNLHAHSTLALLAIHRGDWPEAVAYAQAGLRIDPRDAHSAVLLATAYGRRNGPDDLQTAIDQLQHFVARNRGQLRAEEFLGKLVRRQQLGMQAGHEDEDEPASAVTVYPETDPAWRDFAESIRSWVVASTVGHLPERHSEDVTINGRVLPLPQALGQAVAQHQWDADILEHYDSAVLQEFPLETRVWRYLQALQSTSSSASERDRAKQTVEAWLQAEAHIPTQDNASWLPYLRKYWEAVNVSTESALTAGTEWLKGLLDRYQPLPPPLLV